MPDPWTARWNQGQVRRSGWSARSRRLYRLKGNRTPKQANLLVSACGFVEIPWHLRLTLNTQSKVLDALKRATGKNYSLGDLFNY